MVHLFHADQSLPALQWLSGPRWGTVSRVFVWAARLHSWWSSLQHPRILLWSSGSLRGACKSGRLSPALPIIIWMPMGHLWINFIRMPSLQNLSKSGWILRWLPLFWKKMHPWPYNDNQSYRNHWVCNHNRGFNHNNNPIGNNNNQRCNNPITNK